MILSVMEKVDECRIKSWRHNTFYLFLAKNCPKFTTVMGLLNKVIEKSKNGVQKDAKVHAEEKSKRCKPMKVDVKTETMYIRKKKR